MAVDIHCRQLFCTTANVSFGPIFETDDEAEAFRLWLYRDMGTDPRQLDDPSLRVAHRLFRRAHGQSEPEYEQNDRRYAACALLWRASDALKAAGLEMEAAAVQRIFYSID